MTFARHVYVGSRGHVPVPCCRGKEVTNHTFKASALPCIFLQKVHPTESFEKNVLHSSFQVTALAVQYLLGFKASQADGIVITSRIPPLKLWPQESLAHVFVLGVFSLGLKHCVR
eukprot:571324-Amorphochlora_amoeboformis.AAC.1